MPIDEKGAYQSQSEFIDFVAHELKQPMTAIQGYAKMLMLGLGGELSETQQQFVEVINSNVARMGKLIDDLLQISRLEAGRIELSLAPVSMREIIDEALTGSQDDIKARHHKLQVETPRNLPPALGDRARLIQILTNLVGNAIRYTPDGGTIHVTADRLEDPETPMPHILVTVSDTGIGMSPQEVVRLEEKFFRADHDLVRSQPGAGLGVSIARQLVELHGGELAVESKVNKGSTFSFAVPVAGEPASRRGREE
jgi:signal transduction histidine kinase